MSKKATPEMTRKEALAVLHKLYDAVGWHLLLPNTSEEEKALQKKAYLALRVLDKTFHGEGMLYSNGLCHVCYLRMSMQNILIHAKGSLFHDPCCTTCFTQLRDENKIESIEEWNGETWVEKEVPLCSN